MQFSLITSYNPEYCRKKGKCGIKKRETLMNHDKTRLHDTTVFITKKKEES